MNDNISAPPPADERGSRMSGFLLAWGALIGGYVVAFSLMGAIAGSGGGGSDAEVAVLILIGVAPWLLIIGLIIYFASKGKTQTAKGVALGLASIVALLVLLAAACFTLLSNTTFR